MKDILRISQLPMSLEKPIGEEEDSELGDFVEDETAESPFELAVREPAARERAPGAGRAARSASAR